MAGATKPTASAAIPARVMPEPHVNRRRMGMSCSTCCSDTASTGAMRTARRAGPMAEIIVTPTPTTRQTITVRASNTSGPEGSVTPKTPSNASRPRAARTPRPSPTRDARSPTSAASVNTDRKTCPRLAPTMRSSASSFVRWPTVIENVFTIVNAPTNSAMKANTKSAMLKNPSALLMVLVCSLTTVWPVTTSTPRGSAAAMARWTVGLSDPGAVTTLMVSNWPT